MSIASARCAQVSTVLLLHGSHLLTVESNDLLVYNWEVTRSSTSFNRLDQSALDEQSHMTAVIASEMQPGQIASRYYAQQTYRLLRAA